jgi:hypothetical protein
VTSADPPPSGECETCEFYHNACGRDNVGAEDMATLHHVDRDALLARIRELEGVLGRWVQFEIDSFGAPEDEDGPYAEPYAALMNEARAALRASSKGKP